MTRVSIFDKRVSLPWGEEKDPTIGDKWGICPIVVGTTLLLLLKTLVAEKGKSSYKRFRFLKGRTAVVPGKSLFQKKCLRQVRSTNLSDRPPVWGGGAASGGPKARRRRYRLHGRNRIFSLQGRRSQKKSANWSITGRIRNRNPVPLCFALQVRSIERSNSRKGISSRIKLDYHRSGGNRPSPGERRGKGAICDGKKRQAGQSVRRKREKHHVGEPPYGIARERTPREEHRPEADS